MSIKIRENDEKSRRSGGRSEGGDKRDEKPTERDKGLIFRPLPGRKLDWSDLHFLNQKRVPARKVRERVFGWGNWIRRAGGANRLSRPAFFENGF